MGIYIFDMSTVENHEQMNNNEIENEAVDIELQKAMQNVKVDDDMYRDDSKNVKREKQDKKSKKNRGEDFHDYAKKNDIQLNLEYEDKLNVKSEKKGLNEKPYENKKGKFQGNKNYDDGNKKYKGNYYKNKGGFKKNHFKTGNNKFDLCNMHLPKMMTMLQPIYNPYN